MTTTPLPRWKFERVIDGIPCVPTVEAEQARADLEAENAKLHKLMAWIIDECHVYPEGDEAKAFANRLIAAITHPKAGAAPKEIP